MVLLFVENWQHECCGDSFQVGGVVSWPVRSDLDRAHLSELLGERLAASLTGSVDRHSDDVAITSGSVASVRAAFCRYVETPNDPEGFTHGPVRDTTVLRHVHAVEHRREWLNDLEWLGYVVELRIDHS